jgi:hypothetical protein
MKKVATYKGHTIVLDPNNKVNEHQYYLVFTNDEWSMGKGLRYPEFEGMGSIQECKDNIKYK